MAQTCPSLTLVGEVSISGSLKAMDCNIQAAVETGYNRLFGQGGAFGPVLTAMLTIYVALIAYGFLTGRTRLTLTMMSPRMVTMVLVLSFLSVYPAYHAVFFGLLMNGPDEVTSVLLDQRGQSSIYAFADRLDGLFVSFAEIAQNMDPSLKNNQVGAVALVDSKSMPVTLYWLSGLILLMSTLGVLILARLVLYLMLILGPIFILLALFPQTRGLFNGWLRTSVVFALIPMLTVLGGTAMLMLFVPLLEAISLDPIGAVKRVQPMIMLFMGALIYSAFMAALMWVAATLVKDWQATLREDRAPDRPDQSPPQTLVLPSQGAYGAQNGMAGQNASSSYGGERTEGLVNAVTRDASASGSSTRTEALGLYDPARARSSEDRFSRVEGLGQRFRTPSQGANTAKTPPAPQSQTQKPQIKGALS